MLDSLWTWLTTQAPALPLWAVLAALAVGVATATSGKAWRRLRFFATWVHEGGHALAAITVGFSVHGIRIEKDTSGVTTTLGPDRRLPRILITAAGYPAPAALGAITLFLLLTQHTHAGVAVLIISAGAMLPLQRSIRGVGLTCIIAGIGAALIYAPTAVATLGIALITGYLCAASPRTIWELRRQAPKGEDQHSDADTLASLTRIPRSMWQGIFLFLSLLLPALAALWALG
jgi:hypothetical protein